MTTGHKLFMSPQESHRARKTVQEHLQKCRLRAGQLRESNDLASLIQEAVGQSLMSDLASGAFLAPKDSHETMAIHTVGCPYLPCTIELHDLEPIKLFDLILETHHRGRILFLRRVSPVVELKASSWTVVAEQGSDEAERLEMFLHTSRLGQNTLELGSQYVVKEPYYTLNIQGKPTIRIDHPSDLVISVYSDGPASWRDAHSTSGLKYQTASGLKKEGNVALERKHYWRAHACYTEGLQSAAGNDEAKGTLFRDLRRNRSHVNLLLQRFDEAMADALLSLTNSTCKHEEQRDLEAKAYHRAGRAAYSLGDFEQARDYFAVQESLQPQSGLVKMSLQKSHSRIREKATGVYNLENVLRNLPMTQGRADVASFNGYTEIKGSPGAGRGLFSTRNIEPGQVIMCEKAFCVVFSYDFPCRLTQGRGQKLLSNPSQVETVLGLFSKYKGLGPKLYVRDGYPVLDTFQVYDIVQRNAFGLGQQIQNEDISNASTGLWIRAAHINHSCISNAEKSYVGDLMILRSTRRIAAGEEITHSYDESSDYDERAAALQKTWGFQCRCELCVAEEADGATLRKERQELEQEASAFVQNADPSQAKTISIAKAKRLRRALMDTYNGRRYKGLPRRAVFGIEQWLQAVHAA